MRFILTVMYFDEYFIFFGGGENKYKSLDFA